MSTAALAVGTTILALGMIFMTIRDISNGKPESWLVIAFDLVFVLIGIGGAGIAESSFEVVLFRITSIVFGLAVLIGVFVRPGSRAESPGAVRS